MLKSFPSKTILVCLSFLTLASCHKNLNHTKVTSPGTSIVGGEAVKEKSLFQQSVVGIYDYQDNAVCTGTLIAENLVLTAGHCLLNSPNKMRVIFGLDLYDLATAREEDVIKATQRQVVGYKTHHKYSQDSEEEFNRNDIALLKFSGGLPVGYKPAEILKDDTTLKRGTNIRLVGFGVTKVVTTPVKYKRSKKFQESLDMGEIVCDDDNNNCVEIEMSGDGYLHQTTSPIFAFQETEFILDEKNSGTCSGDSGGPAFLEVDGQLILAGVTSRGTIFCDDQGVYTSVPSFVPWIEQTAKQLK